MRTITQTSFWAKLLTPRKDLIDKERSMTAEIAKTYTYLHGRLRSCLPNSYPHNVDDMPTISNVM